VLSILGGLALAAALILLSGGRRENPLIGPAVSDNQTVQENFSAVKVHFPAGLEVKVKEVHVQKTFDPVKLLGAALEEFFLQHNIVNTGVIPVDVKVLGLYTGIDRVLYIDLSAQFVSNFHGDAADEFMLLRALYLTATSNLPVDDVKILIDGREIGSVGGHFSARRPLKNLVTGEVVLD
jgi:spore germination protein GerM